MHMTLDMVPQHKHPAHMSAIARDHGNIGNIFLKKGDFTDTYC